MAGQNHPSDDELVLFFYGETGAEAGLEGHVEKCEQCQATMARLRKTLETVDSHTIPLRGEGYGREVWARIEPELGNAAAGGRLGWSWLAPRRLALAASLAIIIVAAFIAGRYWSPATDAPRTAVNKTTTAAGPEPAAASAEQARDRVLLVGVGDHLERSQIVLVELMNGPAGQRVDISGAQAWARELVTTNRLMRQTADEVGEPIVADVLDDLGRLLVEVANSPSPMSGTELQKIRNRVDSQGLLFKIRVLDSQLRQREQSAVAPVSHSSS